MKKQMASILLAIILCMSILPSSTRALEMEDVQVQAVYEDARDYNMIYSPAGGGTGPFWEAWFDHGVTSAQLSSGHWGLIGKNGEIVLDFQHSYLRPVGDGFFVEESFPTVRIFDYTGKLVSTMYFSANDIPDNMGISFNVEHNLFICSYSKGNHWENSFYNGFIIYNAEGNEIGRSPVDIREGYNCNVTTSFIDNRLMFIYQYYREGDYTQSYTPIKYSQAYIIESNGNIAVAEGEYDRISSYDYDGLFLVEKDDMVGIINAEGNILVPLGNYSEIGFRDSEGFISVATYNGTADDRIEGGQGHNIQDINSAIYKDGKLIREFPGKFVLTRSDFSFLTFSTTGEKYGLMDYAGNIVIPENCDLVFPAYYSSGGGGIEQYDHHIFTYQTKEPYGVMKVYDLDCNLLFTTDDMNDFSSTGGRLMMEIAWYSKQLRWVGPDNSNIIALFNKDEGVYYFIDIQTNEVILKTDGWLYKDDSPFLTLHSQTQNGQTFSERRYRTTYWNCITREILGTLPCYAGQINEDGYFFYSYLDDMGSARGPAHLSDALALYKHEEWALVGVENSPYKLQLPSSYYVVEDTLPLWLTANDNSLSGIPTVAGRYTISITDGTHIHSGTIVIQSVGAQVDFDSPSAWAITEVNAAIETGLVPEKLQEAYTSSVSRIDVAQMFINLIEQSSGKDIDSLLEEKGVSVNPSAFTDTTDPAVLAANALGIINGVGDNRFDPARNFTRSQIAAIINRVARVLDVDTTGYTHSFTDVSGHWVDTELGWPVHAGIIKGVGDDRFDPEGQLTTEQAIAITYRALNALKESMPAGSGVHSGISEENAVFRPTGSFDEDILAFISDTNPDENFIFSPASVKAALALAATGAAGETRQQLLSVLGFTSLDELTAWYGAMEETIEKFYAAKDSLAKKDQGGEDMEFRILNSIWGNTDKDDEVQILESYLRSIETSFSATYDEAPLSELPGKINAWASEQTNGLIDNVVGNLPQDVAALLTNAIYLRSAWSTAFSKEATREKDFTTASGDVVKKEFMSNTEYYGYYEDGDNKLIYISLKGGISFVAVLGDVGDIQNAIEKTTLEEVRLSIPKLDIESSFTNGEIVDFLKTNGANLAFSEYGDFSDMVSFSKPDYVWMISDIIQKARIKTDEDGLEAAAVTAVIEEDVPLAYIENPNLKEFIADRPFQFYILTNGEQHDILFAGACRK